MAWVWYWLPPLIVMAVIFYVSGRSSLPQAQGQWLDTVIKKIAHIAEFTLLFLFLVRAIKWTLEVVGMGPRRTMERALWAALVGTALYGVSDEVHQSFVPRRRANWYDVVIDVVVPLSLCLLWYGWRRFRRRDPDFAE